MGWGLVRQGWSCLGVSVLVWVVVVEVVVGVSFVERAKAV